MTEGPSQVPVRAGNEPAWSASYYLDKVEVLQRIFGADTYVTEEGVVVGARYFPVFRDVILTLPPTRYPHSLRGSTPGMGGLPTDDGVYAKDVQDTFGAEWTTFSEILGEHRREFEQYFDLVDLEGLTNDVIADLGCGAGRYASHLVDRCKQLILVDFSDAIFVARDNLRNSDAVFVLADLIDPPFAPGAFDFAYSLGVLHHLPIDAAAALRNLRQFAPRLLVYLYYALDNRPRYYRFLLSLITPVRLVLARIKGEKLRRFLTSVIAGLIYWPLSRLGSLLAPLGLDRRIPLADFYRGKSWARLRQDAYDRFFTSIEQRFSHDDCLALGDADWTVHVSEGLPYWHFVYERAVRSE